MYELTKLTETTYYIKAAVNIGLIKINDADICLIDTGIDKDTGRKIRQILDQNKFNLVAIYNTHSHADHIGGNKFLQDRTGCKIYAPEIEEFFVNNADFEPVFLNGAAPYKEQQGKFLMAQKSQCEVLTDEALPAGLKIIELPGHSYNMVGFKTDDGVAFLADSICSELTLNKYKISYVFNIGQYLETLESLKSIEANFFVPAHVKISENIDRLIELNIAKTLEISQTILELCGDGLCLDELLEKVYLHYKLSMNQVQYLLISATVKAYLTWLKEQNKVEIVFQEAKMLWKKI